MVTFTKPNKETGIKCPACKNREKLESRNNLVKTKVREERFSKEESMSSSLENARYYDHVLASGRVCWLWPLWTFGSQVGFGRRLATGRYGPSGSRLASAAGWLRAVLDRQVVGLATDVGWLRPQVGYGRRFGYCRRFGYVHRFGYSRRIGYGRRLLDLLVGMLGNAKVKE
ncbi:hypothetical protein YC2023_016205 [Brassica napus]